MNKNTKETVQTFLTLNETNICQKNNLVHKANFSAKGET